MVVAQEDVGKVLGKQGRTVDAIRTLIIGIRYKREIEKTFCSRNL